MNLLPGWQEVLERNENCSVRQVTPLPLDLPTSSVVVRVARTRGEAAALASDLRATTLAAVAVAPMFAARFQPPPAVAVVAWAEEGSVCPAVLDVRAQGGREALAEILRLPVPIVFHDAKPALLALWAAGIDAEPQSLYDTLLAGACMHLGENHPRASRPSGEPTAAAIQRKQKLEAGHEDLLSLEGQCYRLGVTLPIPPRTDGSLPGVDVRTLAARALWTLHLYVAQQPELVRRGLLGHLHTVEFPFTTANARMERRGVHVSRDRRRRLGEACTKAAGHYAAELANHGIAPPGGEDSFRSRMRALGLDRHFPSLEDDVLERAEGLHPAVRAFRLHRRYAQLARQKWLSIDADRVHPEHIQLGAATGRNSCRNPNLTGIGKILRPVVTAPQGRALLELDYRQIEVGVAAAEHGDLALIDACNQGDAYAAAAQRFFQDDLLIEERELDPMTFRARRPELREATKVFVLSLLYGAAPRTIAARFGISEAEADRRVQRFLSLYPALQAGMGEQIAFGLARGHAAIVTGLRRTIDRSAPERWTQNLLRNTPIQGSAAVVFKKAIVDLDHLYRGTDVWLVLPLHDGVLIECPLDKVEEVAPRATHVMEDALRYYYPALWPKVDVNRAHTECWNKDGRADSLQRFLEDTEFSLDEAVLVSGGGDG